jgi:two-component system, NarL family, sensor kinase
MKFKYFTVLIFLLFAFVIAKSQVYNKDSLQKVIDSIRKLPPDTAQIRKLRETGYRIREKDSALSKDFLEEALSRSFSINDKDAITNCCRMLGIWYSTFGNNDKALDLYRISLSSATSNNNLYLLAGANFNIGNIKYWKGEYDSCIDYYLKAASFFENPKIYSDKSLNQKVVDKKLSDLYSNISEVFNTLKNLPKADEYIDKAIAIAEKNNSAPSLAYYMQQKADNYSDNGNIHKALDIRLTYLPQLEQGIIDKTFLQGAYQSIAKEYLELNKIDSSKLFAQKSLQTAEALKIEDGIANANWQLGRIAMKEKQFTAAETYLQKCSNYFLKSDDPVEKRGYYDVMRQLMFAEGKYKESYVYFEKYANLNDSILNSDRAKQFSDREAKYQSEKKDDQIKLQQSSIKQKRTLNYLLSIGAATLLIISLLSYRNYSHKQKLHQQRIGELETEKQLTATEAVLKGEEQERTRLAKDLHDGLGGMLSGIKYSFSNMKNNLIMTPENNQAFERSMDMLDNSIKEMRRVAHNMMPEALIRYGLDKTLQDYITEINKSGMVNAVYQSMGMENKELDNTTSITIYRIVQELLNNVVKHAGARQVLVQLLSQGDKLVVNVEDDGKGFDTNIIKQVDGIGWKNIKSRIDFLKGKLDVQSASGKGTNVNMEFTI